MALNHWTSITLIMHIIAFVNQIGVRAELTVPFGDIQAFSSRRVNANSYFYDNPHGLFFCEVWMNVFILYQQVGFQINFIRSFFSSYSVPQ